MKLPSDYLPLPAGAGVEPQLQPGPFPIDALSDTQKRIVEAVANVHQLPIELAAMPAIAVTGAALSKGWKLTGAVNGRENYGNLYVIPAAPKSNDKGAAAQLAQPIIEASTKLVKDWKEREKPDLETMLIRLLPKCVDTTPNRRGEKLVLGTNRISTLET